MEETKEVEINSIELHDGTKIEYEGDDFPDYIVTTVDGEYAYKDDVVWINDDVYLVNDDRIAFDDIDNEYIYFDQSVEALDDVINDQNRWVITHRDNTLYYDIEDIYVTLRSYEKLGYIYNDETGYLIKSESKPPKDWEETKAEIEKLAEIYYPQRWDWIEQNKVLYFVIYFPELYVHNNYRKHLIRDLYVGIRFNNYKIQSALYGLRSTFTISEINSGYTHSHLSGLKTSFGSFCLGGGELVRMLGELNLKFDPITFEQALVTIDAVVRYENIQAGPYIRMSKIINGSDEPIDLNDSICENYYNKLIKHKINKISWENNKIKLDYHEIESILETLVVDSNKCFYHPETKKYFLTMQEILIRSFIQKNKLFNFKGNEVITRIVEKEQSTEGAIRKPNPSITKYCINKLSKQLTKKAIEKERNARKTNIDNKSKSVG